MSGKRKQPDPQLVLREEDLQELFEPFDPDRKPARLHFQPVSYPIVLAHGIARPDYLIDSVFRTLNLSIYDFSLVSDRFHYFKGIASFLQHHGFEVYNTSVSFAAGVESRARDLKTEILRILSRTSHEKVHIIAHSMGGLDARHMIVKENMSHAVATLTTIGTPHHGTVVADAALELGIEKVIGILKYVINLEGVKSCTQEACNKFNNFARDYEASNGVIYQAYGSFEEKANTFLPFQMAWSIIDKYEGANDGLISLKSQLWEPQIAASDGTVKAVRQGEFPFRAEHLYQMGWWNLNEVHKAGWWNLRVLREKNRMEERIKKIYLKIAREIQDMVWQT